MDPDKSMIRGQDGDFTNLAIGEPVFLQHHMQYVIPPADPTPFMPMYPSYKGEPALLEALAAWFPGYHAVVTNGAKQALLAAFYALPGGNVEHRVPHWPSYPTLARLSGRTFNAHIGFGISIGSCRAVSCPNNPDGKQQLPMPYMDPTSSDYRPRYQIWDAAYAHWVYSWNGVAPDAQISVYSAAKAFGLSGERVGWALTKNEALADQMAAYVEKTTSGVNVRAQQRVAKIYTDVTDKDMNRAYSYAYDDLQANIQTYKKFVAPHTVGGDVGVGMFAWFRVADPKWFDICLNRAKVTVVSGAACGATEPGWYRMSLGQRPSVQLEALARLGKELSNG